MKIALVSSCTPLVWDGGALVVQWLGSKLTEFGHRVEIVQLPFLNEPDKVFSQIMAFRLIELEEYCDRVITVRPPSHVVPHRNKVVWHIHERPGSCGTSDGFCGLIPDTPYWRSFRNLMMQADTTALRECRHLFTGSKRAAARLQHFNGLTTASVLYPPATAPERFYTEGWGEQIVCIGPIQPHNRQHLLIEAMRHVRSPVRLKVVGTGEHYAESLHRQILRDGLLDKVSLDARWISERETASLLANALACAYAGFDQDHIACSPIEAAHAAKTTVATNDSGAILEFIQEGDTGIVTLPQARALADAFDRLWLDRRLATCLGYAARRRISEMRICWDHVIERILS